jgi:hypothetical protein
MPNYAPNYTPMNTVPNVGISYNPSLTIHNGDIWMAWKGQDTDTAIYVANTDGTAPLAAPYTYSFSPQQKIAGPSTAVAPALYSSGGVLNLFWSDSKTHEIWSATSKDGQTWEDMAPIGIGESLGGPNDTRALTEHAPQVVATNDATYLFYTGISGDIWVATNNGPWANQSVTGGLTDDPPAVAILGNTVHLVWKGKNDNQLRWSTSPVPGGLGPEGQTIQWNWSPEQKIFGNTLTPPALIAPGDDQVWLTWVNPPYDHSVPWQSELSPQQCYWTSDQLCYASVDSKNHWSAASTRLGIPAQGITKTALAAVGNDHADIFMAFGYTGGKGSTAADICYAPLGVPSNTYQFAVTDILCQVTRSGSALEFIDPSSDTNYSSLSVQLSTGGSPVTATMFCGDMEAGSQYAGAGLVDPGPGGTAPQGSTTPVFLTVSDNAQVVMTYGVTNLSGPTPEMTALVSMAAEKLVAAGASAAAGAAGTAIGAAIGAAIGTGTVPLIGSALGALAGWAVSDLWGWAFPNCDGPVAYAVRTFSAADLATSFAGVTRAYEQFDNFTAKDAVSVTDQQPSPGMQPPMVTQSGCGANPQYQITWGITCTAMQNGASLPLE